MPKRKVWGTPKRAVSLGGTDMDTAKIEVLIVDDYAVIRTILKTQLRRMGYDHICEAEDGMAAYEILLAHKIDLIISDWNMPRMTGLELLQAVRREVNLQEVKFIMVTAEAAPDNIRMALEANVDQFIMKPFTLGTLEEKINQVIH